MAPPGRLSITQVNPDDAARQLALLKKKQQLQEARAAQEQRSKNPPSEASEGETNNNPTEGPERPQRPPDRPGKPGPKKGAGKNPNKGPPGPRGRPKAQPQDPNKAANGPPAPRENNNKRAKSPAEGTEDDDDDEKRSISPPSIRDTTVPVNDDHYCYMESDCMYKSKTIEGIWDHVKKEHLKVKEGLACVFEKCTFRGSAMQEMKNHYASVHESRESREAERTTCLLCGARRRTEGEVMRHIRIVHLKDNEYICNACSEGKYATFSLKEWANHVHQNHAHNPPKIEFRRVEGFDPSKKLPMTAQTKSGEVVDLTDGEKAKPKPPEEPPKPTQTRQYTYKPRNTAANNAAAAAAAAAAAKAKNQGAAAAQGAKPDVLFKCQHCPEKFFADDLLPHYEKDHEGKIVEEDESTTGTPASEIFDFLCMLCNKQTKTKKQLKTHIVTIHFKNYSSVCPHCPYIAPYPADLQAHGQKEHYKHFLLAKLLCSKCDYTSKNVEVMEIHANKVHGVEIPKREGDEKLKEELSKLEKNAKKMKSADAKKMNQADAKKMKPADAKKMNPADAKKMKPADAKKMNPVDAKKMNPADAKKMNPADAKKMKPADAKKMNPADAKKMNPADAKKMNPTDVKKDEKSSNPEDVKEEVKEETEPKKEENAPNVGTNGSQALSKEASSVTKTEIKDTKEGIEKINQMPNKPEPKKQEMQYDAFSQPLSKPPPTEPKKSSETPNIDKNAAEKKPEVKPKDDQSGKQQPQGSEKTSGKVEATKAPGNKPPENVKGSSQINPPKDNKNVEDKNKKDNTKPNPSNTQPSSTNKTVPKPKQPDSEDEPLKSKFAKQSNEPPFPKKMRISEPSRGLSKSSNNFDAPLPLE